MLVLAGQSANMDPRDPSPPSEAERLSDPAERRRFRRVAVELPAALFVPGRNAESECRVTNISPAGAEIACEAEKLLDCQVVLYVRALGRFEGQVVWQYDGRYGVKFAASELKQARLADKLAHVEAGSPQLARAAERTRVNRLGSFTRGDGSVVQCVVLDFSTSGVQVKSPVRPELGERVTIGGVVGKVVRLSEAGIGIQFVGLEREGEHIEQSRETLERWRTAGS